MMLTSKEYRHRIITFVPCPWCHAPVGQQCTFDFPFGESAHAARRTAYDGVQHLDPRTET